VSCLDHNEALTIFIGAHHLRYRQLFAYLIGMIIAFLPLNIVAANIADTDKVIFSPMTKGQNKASGKIVKLIAVVLTMFVGLLSVAGTVNAETLPGEITEFEARKLSDPLKTYICSDEFNTPTWCETYRATKFGNSIAMWKKNREEQRKAREAKKAAEEKRAHEASVALAKKLALEAAQTAAAASNDPAAMAKAAKFLEEQKAEQISRAWSEFLKTADVTNLTMDQVMVVRTFAASATLPEANEILGYAYSNGSKSLPANLTEAYRQYGQAYLKGLKRVKPNLDRIWAKIPLEQQMALASEFK
jgi:hypothetical protein